MDLPEIVAREYVLDFEDEFDGSDLDPAHWLPVYLPHWSSSERSAARYEISDGCLHLLIEEDQPPWCPELDGATRVSSIQTGTFAGPVGTSVGQHRFHPEAVVREGPRDERLYTPTYGLVAMRARAAADPHCMVALWLIGYEDRPERSGEICAAEIFGRDVRPDAVRIGVGVHPWADPGLVEDFERVKMPIDSREFHEYAAEWTPRGVTFYVDGSPVRATSQSPRYPMQLMLGIYEFGDPERRADRYPKRFAVDWVRGYRPRTAG